MFQFIMHQILLGRKKQPSNWNWCFVDMLKFKDLSHCTLKLNYLRDAGRLRVVRRSDFSL